MAKHLLWLLLCGSTIDHAQGPGQHMWLSQGPWPDSKCSKTVEVRCSYSKFKPCQSEITTDEIQEKKIIKITEIQKVCVSLHWLERKSLINTSYCMLHKLELKYFTIFAYCSSSSSLTSKNWDLRRCVRTWNLGQIFEIELWIIGQ